MHKEKLKSLSEKDKKEYIESISSDPYEVNNYYKKGVEIIKVLKMITYRSKRLFDQTIDDKFYHLNEQAQKLPNKLMTMHSASRPNEMKQDAEAYLQTSCEAIEKDCSEIHDLLINYLMFRKKKFCWLRKQFKILKEKWTNFNSRQEKNGSPDK
ncbi:MAG: hypothetical protein JSS12_07530 [Verrucomicrobia bacterium]|nr:hypothetical protein [Verrucomicrobiota bacterium]